MDDAFLDERAILYATGAMPPAERENFEIIAGFHAGFRARVAAWEEALTASALRAATPREPPVALKARLIAALDDVAPRPEPEAWVVADRAGRVEWANATFTTMCGYSLGELKGRKPGEMLQGPDTDRAEVARLRDAIRTRTACETSLVNYHKDGTPYRAGIRLAPILDDGGEPVWFVARERKLAAVV